MASLILDNIDNTGIFSYFYTYTYTHTELPLEQHGFELRRSTYIRIFFIVNTTELHDLQLVKSEDVEPLDMMEPWRGSPDCKLYSGF